MEGFLFVVMNYEGCEIEDWRLKLMRGASYWMSR